MLAENLINPWYISEYEIMLRLLLALALGGIIGFEREQSNHAAGFRTNILVCVGACLMMLLSIYGFSDFVNELNVRVDPARLAAAVITGVGFLGAGTILFTGKSIKGLTTAASLWVVAAIGLAVGAGFYFASAAVTIMVFLTLWLFNKLEHRYLKNHKHYVVKFQCLDTASVMLSTQEVLNRHKANLLKMTVEDAPSSAHEEAGASHSSKYVNVILNLEISRKKQNHIMVVIEELKHVEEIRWISFE